MIRSVMVILAVSLAFSMVILAGCKSAEKTSVTKSESKNDASGLQKLKSVVVTCEGAITDSESSDLAPWAGHYSIYVTEERGLLAWKDVSNNEITEEAECDWNQGKSQADCKTTVQADASPKRLWSFKLLRTDKIQIELQGAQDNASMRQLGRISNCKQD